MSALKKVLWYRRRLASMSIEEVFHRLDEAVKRRLDKLAAPLMPMDYGPFIPLPRLREKFDVIDIPSEAIEGWQYIFRQAQSGQYHLLNYSWPECARDKIWHLDPVTGKFWPQDVYGFDIDYRHNDQMGDVKYVWELNRLQYLQPIAAFAFKKRDADAAHFCLSQIESWIDHNPAYRGINWVSGIELALRAISILLVVSFVGEYLTVAQRIKIWNTLEMHGEWLIRYPSKFSSANNHRTAEGLGLFAIGALCPQLASAEQWKTVGWNLLCESSHTQILSDGVGAEQAVSYAAIVLEMLLLGGMIAAGTGMDIAPLYQQQIEQGGAFLRWMTDKAGNQPHIGDDDNGCVIGLHTDDYVRSVLGCIAAACNRIDLTPPNSLPRLRQCLFGAQPAATEAPVGIKKFDKGGYTIARQKINGCEAMLVFDHGHLGFLSIAAHGHADTLSVWLHVDGQPVFVDAGTYLYHAGGAYRDAFRGTAMHNTLCLGQSNSSIISGSFNWSEKAHAKTVASQLNGDDWFVEAEHDGYLTRFNALHRRRVTAKSITDYLIADRQHYVEIGYLLHPDLSAHWEAGEITIKKADQIILRLRYDGPLKTEIRRSALYAPRFGQKETATRIVFSGYLMPNTPSTMHMLFGRN